MEHGVLIEKVAGNDCFDDFLFQLLAQIVEADFGRMLGGDDHGVDAARHASSSVESVLDGHLGLRVGSHPREGAVTTEFVEMRVQLMGKDQRQRHRLVGLIGGITEHESLVSSSDIIFGSGHVHAGGDFGTLLLKSHKHIAGLVVES